MAPIFWYLLRFKLMKVAGRHVFFVFKILIWIVIGLSMNTIRNPCIYLFVQTYQNDSDSQSLSLIIWVGIGLSGASNILFFRGIIGLFSDFSSRLLYTAQLSQKCANAIFKNIDQVLLTNESFLIHQEKLIYFSVFHLWLEIASKFMK